MSLLEDLKQKVIAMDVEGAKSLTDKAIAEKIAPDQILYEALVPAMDQVGQEFDSGSRYVPEMLLSAHAMKEALEALRPLLVESGVEPKGCVVMGTVEGDLHDIGQNLVSMMLEGKGFEVHNLGPETPAEDFVKAAQEHNADIVGISALLTTTMTHIPEVIEALEKAGVRKKAKIMIGGAPVDQQFADEVGADGYGADASVAMAVADRLMGG